MTDPEKYARPGLYLDTDDHERLLDDNREQFLRERIQRLSREIENKQAQLDAARRELRGDP